MYNFFQKCIWIYGFMPQYLWFWIQLLNLSIKFTFTIASNMLTLHFIFYQAYNIILLQVNQLTYLFQDSMICKQISPEYYQQVRQLIYKSFAAQSIVTKILDVSEQEVYRYRYEYTKFNDNNAIIALDPKFNKVVGVIFTKDFLDLAQEVCNEKITYSEGFQFMRQKVLKVIFEDYIKKHPNIKRGEVSYHYSGCVDHQYRNLKLTGNTMIKLFEYNRKCGYKTALGYTAEQRVITTFTKHKELTNEFKSNIIEYPLDNLIYKGKAIKIPAWLVQTQLQAELKPKL